MSNLPVGLDYAGVETVARFEGIEIDADLFRMLQIMENEAVKELNNRG